MKTAGLVLDFYDDAGGELLKRCFPTSNELPDIIKTAHILSQEEREILRDEAFAVVMLNEGKAIRKFACVDAGNTLLSALYFVENMNSLPEEVQKVAAANIQAACIEFGLPLNDLEKIATSPPKASGKGANRNRDPMKQPIVGDDADWAQRTNLNSVRGGNDSGRVIPTASQMKTAMEKEPMPAATKARVEKTINLDSFHKLNPEAKPKKACSKCGSTKNDMRGSICDKCAFPKTANVIDVSSLEAPVLVKKASANETALNGKYSLDTFADVQKAVEFFEENYKHFSPSDRREFAVKTAARAEELTIPLTPVLERYGSPDYASDVDSHLASRRALAPDHKEVWNALQEKRASIEPSAFAELLQEADEEAGLNWLYDGEVSDPFFATFGGNKVKEANALWSWKSRTGEVVNGSQLKRLARDGKGILMKQFDNALVSAFMADPLTIFDSLPDTHKMLLARLALGEYDGMPTN